VIEVDSDFKELPEKVQDSLKLLVDHFSNEDLFVRERQIRTWKKLKYYWDGFFNVWWSNVAHDWRILNDTRETGGQDDAYYDKPINIFRALLESIIAALSVNIPSVQCVPDDPDNSLDISTAKAGDKIAELL
jgi:hypothetical protein